MPKPASLYEKRRPENQKIGAAVSVIAAKDLNLFVIDTQPGADNLGAGAGMGLSFLT